MCQIRCSTLVGSVLLVFVLLLASAAPLAAAPQLPEIAAFRLCFPFVPKYPNGDNALLLLRANAAATANVDFRQPGGSELTAPQLLSLAAGETAVIDLASKDDLPYGVFQAELTSDQELTGVALIRNANNALGVYAAVDCTQASDAVFGPFYAAGEDQPVSALHLMNSGDAPATVSLTLMETGYITADLSIPAHGSIRFITADLPANEQPTEGWGRIQITTTAAEIHGVLSKELRGVTTYANALWNNSVNSTTVDASAGALISMIMFPRIHTQSGETEETFTTQLLIAAPDANTVTMVLNFYNADGSTAGSPMLDQIAGGRAKLYNASSLNTPTGVHSLVIGSNNRLAAQVEMVPTGAAGQPRYSADSLALPAYETSLVVSGLVYTDKAFAVLGLQNSGGSSSTIGVTLTNTAGETVHTVQVEVAAGAAMTLDLRDVPDLAQPFYGAALIASSGPLVGQMDVYSELSLPDPDLPDQSMYLPLIIQ